MPSIPRGGPAKRPPLRDERLAPGLDEKAVAEVPADDAGRVDEDRVLACRGRRQHVLAGGGRALERDPHPVRVPERQAVLDVVRSRPAAARASCPAARSTATSPSATSGSLFIAGHAT